MASRIIHLAICKQLEEALEVKDGNRFRIGHILPDAIVHGNKAHGVSHYKTTVYEDRKKIIDFAEFYRQFSPKLLGDSLYLGYYFHLMEDAVYRRFLYHDYNLASNKSREFVEALHQDYVTLNGYLVKAHELTNTLRVPEHFEEEEINKIYPFILQEFLSDMSNDFHIASDGKTKYFTAQMAEEFIEKCTAVCRAEFENIKMGQAGISPFEYAWDR